MEILVLGGTAFLGRAIAGAAIREGHAVTCAARGTAQPPANARFVTADRDTDEGLKPLGDQVWDAVIDVSRHPMQVRRAVRDLQTHHWVLISSLNVYASFDQPEQSEAAAVVEPLSGDVMEDMSKYGAAKVACEDAVRSARTTATIIRSGLIAGPGDWSGRSGYYPWRFAHPTGPDVLVPDDPDFPCAFIHVDDLANWVIRTATHRLDGTFNATGPTVPLREVLSAAVRVAHSDAVVRPVPRGVLDEHGISAWMGPKSLPLWIDDPTWRYFATMDSSAATRAGLRTRPMKDTLAGALDYENCRVEPRQTGLSDDEERLLRVQIDDAPVSAAGD